VLKCALHPKIAKNLLKTAWEGVQGHVQVVLVYIQPKIAKNLLKHPFERFKVDESHRC